MLRRAAVRPLQSALTIRTRTASAPVGCQLAYLQRRFLADKKPTTSTTPPTVVLPGSSSTVKDAPPVPKLETPVTPSLTPKPPSPEAQVPLTPDPAKIPTAATTPPPPPPPPPPPKQTHRLRNTFLTLVSLTLLTYTGGVYFSLQNDNFHDFFTEYIPFGETLVLEIQDRQFRSRFPHANPGTIPNPPNYASVTIPTRSGATWKLSEKEDPSKAQLDRDGPYKSSKKDEGIKSVHPDTSAVVTVISEKDTPGPKSAGNHLDSSKKKAGTSSLSSPAISPAAVEHHDPIMHDLVKIINSVIEVINTSDAKKHFDDAIVSAKEEVKNVNEKIQELKASAQASTSSGLEASEVTEKLKEQEIEFTKVASGIVQTMEGQLAQVENKWREEFERERDLLAESYKAKLETELKRSDDLSEARLKNELLEQALRLKRQWIAELKDRVEQERDGRLGKLKQLAEEVEKLGEVASVWTETLDENLRTQKMHVALEAVKASVNNPDQPRPFVRELAALKEVSSEDEVVKAAIASINPIAYQKGVSSPAQIIDRFRRVAVEVRKASLVPEDAGVFGHASSWVASKILFTKTGLATSNDVEAILARTETYLQEGELDKAAREMNQLKGWAKTLAGDWLKDVRVLLEVRQAVDVIAAQARLQSLRRE
ncbi:Formation of crista junctions protein 1 [Orbilia oligospora]|uniref:MICOS complex subunit MIC60 n=1 Tax=Orbilia oligospora TaxID=2813651 RepID=A0A8H2HP66_ORBOL|nr:Formation of crista junctions protein 1 [Orbilia oligospora]KAF3243924.1 Formation of crista junctions protein 1 [Orbilia oligospora]KAF3245876.1 Formation of crista junctions protein 1 [Orbilia oligospora]KAF3283922.1 Formation of crista junctions protein 1 [Orbilia oligospora]TGJ73529.1 Formation of crista junctions protein 1 [Orbilia oligospora]